MAMARMPTSGRLSVGLGWSEWILALVATGMVLCFHIVFWYSAGGLWRDEANSVELASLASWSAVWQHLPFDSFPFLWPCLLWIWMMLGFGGQRCSAAGGWGW